MEKKSDQVKRESPRVKKFDKISPLEKSNKSFSSQVIRKFILILLSNKLI